MLEGRYLGDIEHFGISKKNPHTVGWTPVLSSAIRTVGETIYFEADQPPKIRGTGWGNI